MTLEDRKIIISAPLAVIAFLIGDFNVIFLALAALVCIDFISGIIKALNEKNLSSEVMFRGGIKKVGLFFIVMVSNIIDNVLQLNIALRSMTISYFIANEGLSIIENWGCMGLPIPGKLKNVLKQLHDGAEEGEK